MNTLPSRKRRTVLTNRKAARNKVNAVKKKKLSISYFILKNIQRDEKCGWFKRYQSISLSIKEALSCKDEPHIGKFLELGHLASFTLFKAFTVKDKMPFDAIIAKFVIFFVINPLNFRDVAWAIVLFFVFHPRNVLNPNSINFQLVATLRTFTKKKILT